MLAAGLAPGLAQAHSFGRMYNLPVPLWMYVYGAAAALLLSFLIAAYFLHAPAPGAQPRGGDLTQAAWVRALRRWRFIPILRGLSVALLLLTIATGLFGNSDPYRNFSMTFFWVVFVLGFAYLTALIGDLYAAINPWRVVTDVIARIRPRFAQGRWRYPQGLAYWPGLLLYMAFIWIELFVFNRPHTLGVMLCVYTALNLLGVWAVGREAWFRYGEFLGVFLRQIARMAPLDYQPAAQRGEPGRLRWRLPFAGLLEARAEDWSLLLFVLFMLSSTAFDGLHATAPWFKLFWADPYGVVTAWAGNRPILLYAKLLPVYTALQTLCLLLSPFLYLAFYLLFVALAKALTRSRRPLRELALAFALPLLPIALVYHVTHYYTLILTQGVKIVSLLSDPFGWGWNLLGTADRFRAPFLPEMGTVWHTQVGLILLGHIVSVYLAHVEALRLFPTRRAALLSQIPMLILMVAFTAAGLWILAQPITRG
ncbi:MAG: hypothetical protein E6R07_02820 [Nevskiaceae bacterium]|nr:MAG: hypothetical protein E6R07_02820 [Nevskiaceae bacterium]